MPEPPDLDGCILERSGDARTLLNELHWDPKHFGRSSWSSVYANVAMQAAEYVCDRGAMDRATGSISARLRFLANPVTIRGAAALLYREHGNFSAAENARMDRNTCIRGVVQGAAGHAISGIATSSSGVPDQGTSQFKEMEPRAGGRPSLVPAEDIGHFTSPVPDRDLLAGASPSVAPPMADWTVSVERAPLGVGCMPRDASFPSRHEGNYFALGHTMR